jgi:hypothetical protein
VIYKLSIITDQALTPSFCLLTYFSLPSHRGVGIGPYGFRLVEPTARRGRRPNSAFPPGPLPARRAYKAYRPEGRNTPLWAGGRNPNSTASLFLLFTIQALTPYFFSVYYRNNGREPGKSARLGWGRYRLTGNWYLGYMY